jgi:hypothetical protein
MLAGGCTGIGIPMPPTGVSVDRTTLVSEAIISMDELFPEFEGLRRILDIRQAPEGTGDLLVVSAHATVWLDASGRMDRWTTYEGSPVLFPIQAVDLPEGLEIAGMDSEWHGAWEGGEVIRFDLEGRRLASFPTGYGRDFFFTDLVGDEQPEVVIEGVGGKLLSVYERGGRGLWKDDLDAYLTWFCPLDADGDGTPEIVLYLYPVDGAGEFRVLDGETGAEVSRAPMPILGGFGGAAETRDGQIGVLTALGDELRVYSVDGQLLESLTAPFASSFATIRSHLLTDGRRVTALTGDGSLAATMLLVHGADGEILFSNVEPRRGGGLHVQETGDEVVIHYGVGSILWRLRGTI